MFFLFLHHNLEKGVLFLHHNLDIYSRGECGNVGNVNELTSCLLP